MPAARRYRPITPLPSILQAATLPLPVRVCIFWRRTPGIDGATINADGDGIFITSKRKLDGYEDLNALTVSDANVTSKLSH